MPRARQTASGGGFGTSVILAFPFPVLPGSLLIYGHTGDVAFTSLTDTLNVPKLGSKLDVTIFTAVHYVENSLGGSITVTRNHASGNAGLQIAEFVNWNHFLTGSLENVLSASGFSTTPNSGNMTTIWPVQLLIGYCGFESAGAPYNQQAAWQEEVDFAIAGGSGELMTQYVTAAGAYSASGTVTATPNWCQHILGFKLTPFTQPNYGSLPPTFRKRVSIQQQMDELP